MAHFIFKNKTMYQQTIEPFGSFEKYTFRNEKGDSFSIVPQYGANLLNLQFKGLNILDGYDTPEALIENKWSKNIILFPYPNRLRDGRYMHQGKEYQFKINNAATQNSIHGFSKDVVMHVTNTKVSARSASITCRYQHLATHIAYPFRFTFQITYILRGSHFEVKMSFKNEDTIPIPVGLGWHPYFRISEKSDDSFLEMPDCLSVVIDERMLPTGEKIDFIDFKNIKKIDNTVLDNCFYIKNQTENAQTILQSKKGKLTFWQETGPQKWNFLQIFTPPHRMSVAIEPMTCNVDVFNNQDGLISLSPKQTLKAGFGLSFKS
jgi:aldose 1-epimerase